MKKYELLAPVGDFAMLNAAVNSGADAVFFGLKNFNMRAAARNFEIKDLKKIRKICDSSERKVKMYLTLNIVVYSEEIKKVEDLLRKSKKYIDAVICWDFSVINLCKKLKIPFHVSTQASISNVEAAKFYEKIGAERIVLARELSLKQVADIIKNIKIPVECFCHGAMCVSVSGRCFMSLHLDGKSANRGECTQPCRRSYEIKEVGGEEKLVLENNRVMSAKDLCTLPFLDKLKKAGIFSFKIEGRNRTPEYVSAVVSEYRKALNKKLNEKEIILSLENLKKVYNRGFSDGFYLGTPTRDDFSKSETGEQTERKVYVGEVRKYLNKIGVAIIDVSDNSLSIGDETYIIGDKTGCVRYKIDSLQINNSALNKIEKGQEAGVKLPLCREGDKIYLIKKK